jgi:hypothetical protein
MVSRRTGAVTPVALVSEAILKPSTNAGKTGDRKAKSSLQ